MPYTMLLNNIIDNSGLSIKEIAENCTKNGVKVTAAYISTLKNDKNNRTPSDEVSRAIARACNYDENELVIEAYIDNAPEEFSGVFNMLRDCIIQSVCGIFENTFPQEYFIQIKKEFLSMPMGKLIKQLNEYDGASLQKQLGAMNFTASEDRKDYTLSAEIRPPEIFVVSDDSMFPTLPKGSKVAIEMKEIPDYKNGDIVVYCNQNSTQFQYRKIAFLNDNHDSFMLYPINANYESHIASIENTLLIGKVTKVTTEIK